MMASPCGDSENSEVYCWPCFGIVANIANDPGNVNRDGQYSGYWMRKFSDFKPLGIGILLNKNQCTEYVVVTFKNDWSGFKNGMAFEKSFEDRGRGKMGWIQRRTSAGSRLYGWVAREDDYKLDGPMGDYLRSNGALKTVRELIQEVNTNRGKTICDLMNESKSRNEYLNQLRGNYIHKRMSTVEMLQEQDKMYRCFEEATMKLQCFTLEHMTWVVEEQEMLKFVLESKRDLLDSWRKDLTKREEALNEREGRILDVENLMIELRNREEALAERERRILKVEDIKREKEAIEKILELEKELGEKRRLKVLELERELEEKRRSKVIDLERELEEKWRLETEIQELKDQMKDLKILSQDLLVKERLCNDELQRVRKELLNSEKEAVDKVLELERKLDEEHKLEIEELKDEINVLIVKERQSNDALQGCRKELMRGLSGKRIGPRAKIGIKKMGEIDPKAFMKTCNERFPPEDVEIRALELCSLWQEKLKNPQWHPVRVVENNTGVHQRVLEDDELLRGLKDEWGEEIYDAVVTALRELHEYNASGCYLVQEFWNFKENRKATFTEVIGHVFAQLKTHKRKRHSV